MNTNVRYGGIYIKTLVPGGAADQDGRIQIGNLSFKCIICTDLTFPNSIDCNSCFVTF